MDFSSCKTILKGSSEPNSKFSRVVVFRAFKTVVEMIVERRKGQWAQLLIEFDFRAIAWDFNKFQSILLLFSSLSLFSDHSAYPCVVTTALQKRSVAELCDEFFSDLVVIKEWSPLHWRAVHNISRIVTMASATKQSLISYLINFLCKIPEEYEDHWIKNCSYFCHSLNTAVFIVIEMSEASVDVGELSNIFKAMVPIVCYFESYKLGSPVDKNLTQIKGDDNIPESQKSLPTFWARKIVNKILTFLLKSFRKNYIIGKSVSMENALNALDFSSVQVQSISLMVVLSHIRATPVDKDNMSKNQTLKKKHDNSTSIPRSAHKEKGKLKNKAGQVRNALKLQDAVKKRKSPQLIVCEKLCHSGSIRKIFWCLLSKCYNTRMLALEVLSAFENVFNDDKVEHQNIWQAHAIEQGVVPLLELIACGFPVANTRSQSANECKVLFPEKVISSFAECALKRVTASIADDVSLQEKLELSLLHTKNAAIRGNIFAGLIFLSTKNPSISSLMLRSSRSNGEKNRSIFEDVLAEVYLEESLQDFKKLVKVMHHFFLMRSRRVDLILAMSSHLDIENKVTENCNAKQKLSSSSFILAEDKFNGTLVKMQCPDKKTLKAHSNRLLLLMENGESRADPNGKGSILPVLTGFYHIWQEIFSHMIDDYVMDTTLAATGVPEILDLYRYSCKYELSHLCMRYTKELTNRLSTESFMQIFPCSIEMMKDTVEHKGSSPIDPTSFNLQTFPSKLSLCCHCLRFFIERVGKIATPQNLQRKLLISEALELYFEFLLIAQ